MNVRPGTTAPRTELYASTTGGRGIRGKAWDDWLETPKSSQTPELTSPFTVVVGR